MTRSRAVRRMRDFAALGTLVLVCTLLTLAVQSVVGRMPLRAASPPAGDPAPAFRPTEQPDRIILTWNADPATSQAVTWRTVAGSGDAVAQVAHASADPRFRRAATPVPATTTALRTQEHGVVHYHTAEFTDLEPNTTYAYRVGDGRTWSEWFHFTTAGAATEPFSFIYLGDAQTGIQSLWSRTLRAAYAHVPQARFILHAGDLVNRPHEDAQWGEWFAAGAWLYAMVPSIPVTGNHEHTEVEHDNRIVRKLAGSRLSRLWNPQFALPANGPGGLHGSAYYLDVQGARIVVLNSSQRSRYREQAEWLDRVLTENTLPWSIVVFHHPVHASSEERRNPAVAREWQPVLQRHAVDLVLQGHDHSYMRRADRAIGGDSDNVGPVYVVSVAGPKMYDREDDDADRAGANLQLFQAVHVESDRIRFEARLVTGELFDAFDIVRTEGGGRRLVERLVAPVDVTE